MNTINNLGSIFGDFDADLVNFINSMIHCSGGRAKVDVLKL